MIDGIGRNIEYLRISLTDRCNLRCRYCTPETGVQWKKQEEILSLEEIYRIVACMEPLGIHKVRLTGGEPLVRRNIEKLIYDLNQLDGIQEICMTTNGVLLADRVQDLKQCGLTSVNISLDTLKEQRFEEMTGVRCLQQVLRGIEVALEQGLKVKINCVPCQEFNGEEVVEICNLAKEKPLDVRFIELMPLGCGREYTGISSDQIRNQLDAAFGKGVRSYEKRGNGPSVYYDYEGFQGKIGFISPMSHQFCGECNRVRLTCEGVLKLCLHYDRGIDLMPMLRGGVSDVALSEAIRQAILQKPKQHEFERIQECQDSDQRKMVQIGG